MPPLTEWESLSHCMALFATAALVDGAKPQSPLLVGPPSQGKSSMVKRFVHWPLVGKASDLSASGLDALMHAKPDMRLILIDELQRIMSHTRETVLNVTGSFLSLMSGDASQEWVGPTGNGKRTNYEGRQLAIMSALPVDVLASRANDFAQTGLLSRFTTLSVKRSPEESERVKNNIIDAARRNAPPETLADLQPYPVPSRIPRKPMPVTLNNACADDLKAWAFDVLRDGDDRRIAMAVTLTKSIALLNGRSEANKSDVRCLRLFTAYLTSLQFNGIAHAIVVPPLTRQPSWVE